MLSIVVARYNEDLEWLDSVKEHIWLYNKGPSLTPEQTADYASYKELPNVGREAHTYLEYIVDNYHKLPPVVCFTQGKISDHFTVPKEENAVNILIGIMNSAVLSESGYSANFQPFSNNKYCGPYFNTEMDDPRFVEFFRSEKNYNKKMIPLKEWFENTLRIPYPQTLTTCWNGIFAVRSDLIKRRSLNFYKSLLGEVDRINAPVEAHFFERSWYYVFQQPDSDIDGIFICHKNPLATYKTLEGFRKYHPWSKIYLISDNGYDYSEMAKHFNCEYKHLDESINALYPLYKNLDYTTMRAKYDKFWELYKSVFESSSAKFIIKLEDDVNIQNRIKTTQFHGMINGPTLYKLPDVVFQHYYRNELDKTTPPSGVFFSGHGGCVFNREQLLTCLANTEVVERVIESYRECGIQGGVLVEDLFLSIIATVMGYKIQNNLEQMEVDTERYIKNREQSTILHQVKDYYDKQLPEELAHLVKMT